MHVDIVKNEWLAGFQNVVAKLYLEDGAVQLKSGDADRWRDRLLAAYEVDGTSYDPYDAEPFLAHIHEHFRGDYLFATELHEDDRCEFHEHLVRPIERSDGRPMAHTVGD